jgi:hypothetical protein
MALPHLGTLPFDHLARRRGQHAIEGFLVGREGAAFAALGFTDDRRIVVPAHGIFERHPPSVQSAGKTPLRLVGSAESLCVREDIGGELLSLAGDLQEESFDGRIPNMVRRIPESVLSVPAGRDQSVQRPTLCMLGHRFPSYAIFRTGFKNKARRKRELRLVIT